MSEIKRFTGPTRIAGTGRKAPPAAPAGERGVGDLLEDRHRARRAIRDLLVMLELRGDRHLIRFLRRTFQLTHPAALHAVDDEKRLCDVLERLVAAPSLEAEIEDLPEDEIPTLRALARRAIADSEIAVTLLGPGRHKVDRSWLIRRGALREIESQLGQLQRSPKGRRPGGGKQGRNGKKPPAGTETGPPTPHPA